ncbi:MAG: squalene--hopene cyclase [Planctomycetaceae bacterium]|nr:squalene--hopene cyclase [Planctomycetaceae bacterium]
MSALSTEPNVQSLDRIRAAVQAKWILRQEREPLVDGRPGTTLRKIVEQLRSQQRSDGGWGQFPGSGIDISGSVKGYFCLKLAGDSPDAPHMKRAREVILRMGGAERCNSFTNFYLACLGQISWNAVPSIPPEMVWMPRWFYFHLDKMSAWSRTMLLPLAIVTVLRPTRQLDAQQGIDELFVSQQARHRLKMRRDVPAFWRAFFGSLDWIMKRVHDVFGTRWRRRAIEQAFNWSATRMGQEMPAPTSGLGAIFPPMVYIQVVMQALGMSRGEPMVKRAERELDEFMIEEGNRIRLQPCFSPVWDTGIALYALADCGLDATNPMAEAAGDWLRSKEVRHRGDWAVNVAPGTEPGGWFFEYANAWYPDVDDTAMVAMSLRRIGGPANIAAAERGVRWILSMQNDDGGWAAFDKTKDRPIYEFVPFADHNAIQDPSCPDITGRVLECLSWHGLSLDHPAIRRAVQYIETKQEREGCFFGRWGVNYIYGTWQAVIGPIRCGVRRDASWIKRAGAWVKSVQKADGSFGESANSYENPSLKGQGPSTASQTAWAAMILQEIYGANDPDLQRAVEWLARTQLTPADAADPLKNPDGDPAGSWCETEFTGTGFPKVFYLRYHMYRLYFPLMAMGRFVQARAAGA